MARSDYAPPVSRLLTMGDARGQRNWPNYRALGLGPEHVPDLIRMALDEDLHWSASDSDQVWAPIHAWRALGQLRAGEAVEPLIRLLPWIDEYDFDWVAEELPDVFGLIGAPAIARPSGAGPLADYLDDDERGLWGRLAAAHGLVEIGQRHPEARDDCVAALVATLERFNELDPELNGFLVSYLVDLKAVEAAPLIERAFDADRVAFHVMGDWMDVQSELGLFGREIPPRRGLGDIDKTIAQRRLRDIGRNDPCWCGSGRKYKHCHMRDDQQTARR